jgi:NitT/TauT family transport system substrate-binding protein
MKRTLFFLPFIIALFAITGCVAPAPQGSEGEAADANTEPLRVAVLPITDVVPFYVAQDQGYYADNNVNVELIPVSSGAERDTVVQTGKADCELTDIHGVVLTNASDALQLRVISSARQATPEQAQFYLLSSPQSGIESPEELAGASIGISENTIIDYWTERMLTYAGVDPDQVNLTNTPQIPVRLELLLNGKLDAAVLPDPLAALAQLQGATVVLDDSQLPQVGVSVIACRQDAIQERGDDVKALLAAWDQAVEAINADPAQFQDILIENTRVPEPLQGQYTLPQFPVQALPSEAQVVDVVNWAMDRSLIEEPLTYDQVVDSTLR